MEHSFYFESKFREWQDVNYLKFQTPDGTAFIMSEEWLIVRRKNQSTPMQRIIFLKENNYDKKYRITVEVSSSVNYTSGKIVLTRETKPLRTSIIILLKDFKHLNYCVQEKVSIEGIVVSKRVIKDTFRYKVAITRLHASQENNEVENIPERDKVLIFSDQIHSLLETGEFFDITIIVRGSVIRAHRNILRARSVYFECMFQHNWRENGESTVYISDKNVGVIIDVGLIQEMLHYIYSGVIRPMEFKTMFDLFVVADMYMLYDLKELLSEELRRHLVVENAVGVYILSEFASDVHLKFYCLTFIIDHFNQVQHTEFWKRLLNEREFPGVVETISQWKAVTNSLRL